MDDVDFIAMEYVRGKNLDALIPRQGMRLSEVLRIAIPVADALAAAGRKRQPESCAQIESSPAHAAMSRVGRKHSS